MTLSLGERGEPPNKRMKLKRELDLEEGTLTYLSY